MASEPSGIILVRDTSPTILVPGRCPPIPGFAPCPILISMPAPAVGNAIGRNPVSVIVPCHRVIGAKGNLTGYAGGIERKAELLKIEQNQNATEQYPF